MLPFLLLCFFLSGNAFADSYTIIGQVTHIVSGNPVRGVHLGLATSHKVNQYETKLERLKNDGHEYETKTDSRGRFHFDAVQGENIYLLGLDSKWGILGGEVQINPGTDFKIDLGEIKVGEGARVFGTVFNEDYTQPMAGVTVELQVEGYQGDEPLQRYTGVTGKDGGFEIGGIPAGNYLIGSANNDGFIQISSVFREYDVIVSGPSSGFGNDGTILEWGKELGPLEFTVERGARVRGRVVDTAGKPVEGAEVYQFSGCREEAEAYSADDGTFTLSRYELGDMPHLQARKGELLSRPYLEKGLSEKLFSELVLEETGSVRGTVEGPNGGPLPPFKEYSLDINSIAANCYSIDSDNLASDGKFYFDGLASGEYALELNSSELLKVEVKAGQHLENVIVRLPAPKGAEAKEAFTIHGKVTQKDGTPVANARVITTGTPSVEAISDAEGNYTLEVPTFAGQYTGGNVGLHAIAKGLGYATVNKIDKNAESIDFELGFAASASVKVIDEKTGLPVEEFALKLKGDAPSSLYAGTMESEYVNEKLATHAGGVWKSDTLWPGAAHVTIVSPGHLDATQNFLLEGGKLSELEIKLRPVESVIGLVLDAKGYPVPTTQIQLTSADPQNANYIGQGLTDRFGKFSIDKVPHGNFSLRASRNNQIQATLDIVVPGKESRNLRVTLGAGSVLFGQVLEGGKPVEGVGIQVTDRNKKQPSFLGGAGTNASGEFRIEGLPIGIFVVRLEQGSDTFTQREVTLAEGETRMDFALTPKDQSLDVKVTGGAPIQHASVWLKLTTPTGESVTKNVSVFQDGLATLDSIPVGEGSIQVALDEGARIVRPVKIVSETSNFIHVDLDSGVKVSGRINSDMPWESLTLVAIMGRHSIETFEDVRKSYLPLLSPVGRLEGMVFTYDHVVPGPITFVVGKRPMIGTVPLLKEDGLPKRPTLLFTQVVEVADKDITDLVLSGTPK